MSIGLRDGLAGVASFGVDAPGLAAGGALVGCGLLGEEGGHAILVDEVEVFDHAHVVSFSVARVEALEVMTGVLGTNIAKVHLLVSE